MNPSSTAPLMLTVRVPNRNERAARRDGPVDHEPRHRTEAADQNTLPTATFMRES